MSERWTREQYETFLRKQLGAHYEDRVKNNMSIQPCTCEEYGCHGWKFDGNELLDVKANAPAETPIDSYTPILWALMHADERYAEYVRVRQLLTAQMQEVERLKAGKFTAEEVHEICHNLHGTVDTQGFADGCAAEQRKLYGCAPDRDRVEAQAQEIASVKAICHDVEEFCGWWHLNRNGSTNAAYSYIDKLTKRLRELLEANLVARVLRGPKDK